jgi:predicted outer membrane protein
MNLYSKAFSGAALVLSCGFLPQDPPNRQPGTQTPATGTQQPPTGTTQQPGDTRARDSRIAGHETNDAVLTTWLLVDNENEIAISRIGTQRAQSPEVRQFAQRMVDDHSQMVQKLRQANTNGSRIGRADTDPRTGTGTGTEPRTGTGTQTGTEPRTTGTGTGNERNREVGRTEDPTRDPGVSREPKGEYGTARDASSNRLGMAQDIDHERLLRDLGQKCLQSKTKMLQEKSGAEFDKAFMSMQVAAHMDAVDKMEVFRNYASPSLKPTLDEGLKTVQMHLEHAKELCKRTETAMADVGRK